MNVYRISQLTGEGHIMQLDITQDQLDRFEAGELVQKVFPHLTAPEREFLLSGITQDEWDAYFSNRSIN